MRVTVGLFALLLLAGQSPDLLRDAAVAFDAGDMPKAINLYREFLKSYPYAAEIRSNLGAALVRSGQFEPAIAEYKAALKFLPESSRVRMNLALAYYKLGQFAEAIPELEAVRQKQPLESKPALLLADCYIQTGQAQKAVELLKPLQQEFPEDRAVAYLLGATLVQLGRAGEAQPLLDGILRGGESAESEYLLGQNEHAAQNLVAAEKHLKRAVELNPQLPGVHSLYGQVLRSLAKLDEAAAQFQAELKVNPFDYTANVETAMLFKQDGKLDEAQKNITRALQARPKDPGALLQQASIHLAQGKLDQARQELEQLVKDNPDFAEAHASLATAYYRLKRPADGNRERDLARKLNSAPAANR
jgi:tetratricopeptide (TPR) repeat protein